MTMLERKTGPVQKKVMVVLGTRPEAIKLCPVIDSLRELSEIDCHVCVTAQHREMLDSVLRDFEIEPDTDLDLMRPRQSLASLTSRMISALDATLSAVMPDVVLVQGDTTTVLAASITAYYRQIAVGHVEAGLRTGNKYAPFPEEINRRLVAPIADYNFAPTPASRDNLLSEGIQPDRIFLTGNTVIDALLWVRERNRQEPPEKPLGLPSDLEGRRMILVTGHRRENFGKQLEQMCLAMRDVAEAYQDVEIVYPVHLNPAVQGPVRRILEGVRHVHLLEPQEYRPFVWLMDRCHFVLTDSGGVQEEAPALGKPVLVMRNTTERPEGVAAGNAKLVGTNRDGIASAVRTLLDDSDIYRSMATARNPYGDGHSAERIAAVLAGRTARSWTG